MKANLKIALRDSKTATRSYVVMNPLLGKHLQSTPSAVLAYFRQLAEQVAATCQGERVLVIGFAETATAVGAAVASAIEGAVYVHTTRENMPSENLVAEFLEEHSHARNQAFFLCDNYCGLSKYDRIVFVEDEITTGKTILNFLRNIDYHGKITVSALVFNGFDGGAFADYEARFCCVQSLDGVHRLEYPALPNPRLGVDFDNYAEKCRELASAVIFAITGMAGKNILVLGTEEFMYPAIILGSELEKIAASVVTHSTTRTPLLPKDDGSYPIRSRTEFGSVYDADRITYLYNLGIYEIVIVLTDSADCGEGIINALRAAGNMSVYYVRVGA
ncbi:hypothetical protein FACS1894216_09240 [Synergistales bacterium]|nr:hypothetical protein FACS1894216_09240 [Synergistales bacterium]